MTYNTITTNINNKINKEQLIRLLRDEIEAAESFIIDREAKINWILTSEDSYLSILSEYQEKEDEEEDEEEEKKEEHETSESDCDPNIKTESYYDSDRDISEPESY